jgi:O-antigen ligase
MSRRKDKAKRTPAIHDPAAASITPGQDLLRRALLGFVTALVVARPLVATEDPGLRSLLPDTSGMVLTGLWLVALLGWTGWRFWTRKGGVPLGFIDWALLALAGLNLLSAWVGAKLRYAAWYPASLMTWEWFTFFAAFFLVRRLAAWPGAGHGILAALLATGVMLAVYAAYQYVVEIPANAALTPAQLEAQMIQEGISSSPDEFASSQLMERAQSLLGTFGHPNSFAGYLALLLPVALGWALAGWRAGGWTWQTELLAACAALICLALCLTKSRGAIIAALFVAAVAAVWLGRRLLTFRRMRALVGLVALSLAIGGLTYAWLSETTVGKAAPRASVALRIGYWKATWKMIGEQPWLGVGPGNFGRHYPAFMSESDYEEVQNPHNFLLELWATCGFLGMAALLVALGVFLRRVLRHVRSVPSPDMDTGQEEGQGTPWEFYLGGMAGLILGFFLEAWHLSADLQILRGAVAAVRSLCWFPAFALFFSVRWTGPSRTVALTAGVVVLLLNLCVSDGISVPGVAIPLWVVIALVVSSWEARMPPCEEPAEIGGQFAFLRRVLPIPACAILVLVYGASFLLPTLKGADLATQSLRAQEYLRSFLKPSAGKSVPGKWVRDIRRNPVEFVRQQILRPLQLAHERNPEDARYLRALAIWTSVAWQMQTRESDADRESAVRYALHAQELDPVSRDGWLIDADLCTLFGRRFQLEAWSPILAVSTPWGPFPNLQLPSQPLGAMIRVFEPPSRTKAGQAALREWEGAEKSLAEAVRLGPTQNQIRYRLVTVYQLAGHREDAKREARTLLAIEAKTKHTSRRVTDEQREHLRRVADLPNK